METLLSYGFIYAVGMDYPADFLSTFRFSFLDHELQKGALNCWWESARCLLQLQFDSELRMEGQFCTEGVTGSLGSFYSLVTTHLLGQSLYMLLTLLGCVCTQRVLFSRDSAGSNYLLSQVITGSYPTLSLQQWFHSAFFQSPVNRILWKQYKLSRLSQTWNNGGSTCFSNQQRKQHSAIAIIQ